MNDSASLEPGYWWSWRNETHKLLYQNFTRNLVNITPVQGPNSSYGMGSPRKDVLIKYPHVLPKVHQCPREESCMGGLDAECADGYEGPLCEVCSAGHYKQFQTCQICPSNNWMAGQLSITAAIITIIIALLVWISKKKSKSIGRSWVDIVLGKLKIVIGFYQVTFGLLEAFYYIKWPESLELIGKYSKFIQLNVLQIAPIHCLIPGLKVDAFGSLFAILAINAFFIIISFVIYEVRKFILMRSSLDERDKMAKTSEAKELIYRNLFFVLYVTYLSTCSKIANVLSLACRELCVDENDEDCPKYLKADYSIKCHSPRYNRLVVVAYCAIIYIIFLPAASMIILWKQRKMSEASHADNEATQDPQEESTDVGGQTGDETSEHVITEIGGQTEEERSNKPNQSKEVITGLRFLIENYNSHSWYWELVDLGRKVVLTSGLILMGGESRGYVGLAFITSGLYAVLFAYVHPILDPFENNLMLTSLTVTVVNLAIGAVSRIPKENVPASVDPLLDNAVFTALVIGANCLVIGLLVGKCCAIKKRNLCSRKGKCLFVQRARD